MGKGTMGELCYFDTHTHYNDRRFEADLTEVLRKVREAGVLRDTIIGYDLESSKLAVRMAEAQRVGKGKRTKGSETDLSDAPEAAAHMTAEARKSAAGTTTEARKLAAGMTADAPDVAMNAPLHTVAVGIHPLQTGDAEEEDLIQLEILAEDETVVAIGEIGLDYHRKEPEVTPDKETQQRFFRKQLRIARRAGLPVVIHSRDAAQDTVRIMEEEKASEVGGVVHCYSYSPEMSEIFLNMGFYLGIGGVVTRPNSRKLKEVVARTPLERILLETDCPYLAPEGHQGERNDSSTLPQIAATVAELKGCDVEEVCRVTWENACRLYRIPATI